MKHLICLFARRAILFSVLLLIVFSIASCRKKPGQDESKSNRDSTPAGIKVRLGYMPFTSDLAIYVAMERGYFKDEGIDVELLQFKSATDNLNALLAGRTDMTGMIGIPTLLPAYEKVSDQFLIFLGTAETETHWASAFIVPPDSSIKSLPELKGKVVGTYEGTTQLLNLRSILQNFMDPEKDVTIIQVRSDIQLAALQSRQFDTLFTIEPSITIALDKGIGRLLVENPRYKYILQPFPVTANTVSVKFYKNNPKAVVGVYKALARAAKDIREDEASTKQYLPKYTPLDATLAQKCHLYFWWLPDDVDRGAVQKLANLFHEQGLLKTQIDTDKMFLSMEQKP